MSTFLNRRKQERKYSSISSSNPILSLVYLKERQHMRLSSLIFMAILGFLIMWRVRRGRGRKARRGRCRILGLDLLMEGQ